MNLTVVIPCYNEEESLKKILPELVSYARQNSIKVIAVDDGSKDATYSVLKNFESDVLKVLRHKINRGYGSTLKTGISESDTEFTATMDSDGQHSINDIKELLEEAKNADADMVIGTRNEKDSDAYRRTGKKIIRYTAGFLMPLGIKDMNSGMKLYRTELAKKYLHLCPDSMAFSDVITLVFLNMRHRVAEVPITIGKRETGKSTININTAFETITEILNIVMLFNPLKIFLPSALILIIAGFGWGLPIMLQGKGVSVGAALLIISGLLILFMGLIAEQLSYMRKRL